MSFYGSPSALPEVLQTNQVTFQDFYETNTTSGVYLAILVPIFDEQEGGHPLGVLVLRIDPRHLSLSDSFPALACSQPDRRDLLVRREGNEVVFLMNSGFKETAR